jgi:trigger factor
MQVSVEKTSELSRKMTVSVPEAVVRAKMEERLKTLARQVKIDGFRPGKVPQHVVNKMFGDKVRGEITGDLIQSTFYEALQNHDLKPAGYPHILPADEPEGFKYIAEFEVYPEITLSDVNGLEIVRPTAHVEEADVDAMIEKLRAQRKTWDPAERPAQMDDRVTLNFSGTSEGENFTDGRVSDYPVEIGSKRMIPGFEDQLIGLKAGDAKTFSITFPENYNNEKLAGKEAEFEVEAVKVEAAQLPDIDEAFIKSYGIEQGTPDEFRQDVKNNMERELETALRAKLKNAVLDALYVKVPVTVPNVLLNQEVERLMEPYKQSAKKNKIKVEDMNIPAAMFEDQARRRVSLGLTLNEIIRQNEIKLDETRLLAVVENMAKSYERPDEVVAWYYADKERLADVQQMVLEEQAVDWLVKHADITEATIAFAEVMENHPQ